MEVGEMGDAHAARYRSGECRAVRQCALWITSARRASLSGMPARNVNPTTIENRVKRIMAKLPEAACVPHGDHLLLEVRGKRFGWYMNSHHGDGRLVINCKTSPGTRLTLEESPPIGYHIPKYVGKKGWVGLWLDVPDADWAAAEDLLREAYRLSAPAKLRSLV
jgi:predicted DNA-binding protein (MmcQ/YjbR family)